MGRPVGQGKLAPHKAYLKARIEVDPATLSRLLRGIGLTCKKTLVATERDRPDLNPIEMAFSKLKAHLRKAK